MIRTEGPIPCFCKPANLASHLQQQCHQQSVSITISDIVKLSTMYDHHMYNCLHCGQYKQIITNTHVNYHFSESFELYAAGH